MKLLVEGFGEECDEVVPGGGDVVGTVSQRLLLVHVRLVAVDCSAEPWALDWVRVLAFVCAWS